MKRDYTTGETDNVQFFIGTEVEHTPAFGMKTLFVTGIQSFDDIAKNLNGSEHIFFGANHSFNPQNNLDWQRWESMIEFFFSELFIF